jgi:predicted O-methyltransferase YrrM
MIQWLIERIWRWAARRSLTVDVLNGILGKIYSALSALDNVLPVQVAGTGETSPNLSMDKSKAAMNHSRSLDFSTRQGNRYWWFQDPSCKYIPTIFSSLSDEEWHVIDDWYRETDIIGGPGECNVPLISLIQGLIMGNSIRSMVQCGHYMGFSALLCGFFFRIIGAKHALFSIDIDTNATEFTKKYIHRAGLEDYVHLELSDSADSRLPHLAREYFQQSDISLVFIDSSHQYGHTLRELDLWYPALPPGGLILLHDVSQFASTFDTTNSGGVYRAVTEWQKRNHSAVICLNSFVFAGYNRPLAYKDGCGVGIIQKIP